MIKISIIIPIYNVEAYLERCLASILAQTLKDIEIICVNDKSPDNCHLILEKYKAMDERIKIINHETNMGVATARNTGLERATGEFVAFVDSDDWIALDYCEVMLKTIETSGANIVDNANVLKISPNKEKNLGFLFKKSYRNKKQIKLSGAFSLPTTGWAVWNKLYRRDFLNKINMRFPDGKWNEDIYFNSLAMLLAGEIPITTETTYYYFQKRKNDNAVPDYIKVQCDVCPYLLDISFDFYKQNNLLNKHFLPFIRYCRKFFFNSERKDIFYDNLKPVLKKIVGHIPLYSVLYSSDDIDFVETILYSNNLWESLKHFEEIKMLTSTKRIKLFGFNLLQIKRRSKRIIKYKLLGLKEITKKKF
jgi:glycosyltransferase involved in cell wall biosynthesis